MEASTVHAITVKDNLAFPEVAYVAANGELWWQLRRLHQTLTSRKLLRTEWDKWQCKMLVAIDNSLTDRAHYFRRRKDNRTNSTPTVVSSEALLLLYAEQHEHCRTPDVKGAYLALAAEYCKRCLSCLSHSGLFIVAASVKAVTVSLTTAATVS